MQHLRLRPAPSLFTADQIADLEAGAAIQDAARQICPARRESSSSPASTETAGTSDVRAPSRTDQPGPAHRDGPGTCKSELAQLVQSMEHNCAPGNGANGFAILVLRRACQPSKVPALRAGAVRRSRLRCAPHDRHVLASSVVTKLLLQDP